MVKDMEKDFLDKEDMFPTLRLLALKEKEGKEDMVVIVVVVVQEVKEQAEEEGVEEEVILKFRM